jgi:type I restriction enzyme, S subunit
VAVLKPYSNYKNVDLFWLNKIPEHWQIRKVKHLFAERGEKGYPEKPLLAATQTKGVVTKELYENRTVLAQKDLHLLKLVKAGDFVISLRSFQGGIEYARYEGIISPAYTIMVPSINISNGYFRHLAKSKVFIELLKQCVTGIREGQNIDYSIFKNSLIPFPPKEEQDQIVRYLDSRLVKINKFIRNKKRLIELLKEQKQAVINQAVTKGLDPDAKMKPSGVDWLGDVPVGWRVVSLKNIVRKVKTGGTPKGAEDKYFDEEGYDWYTPGDFDNNMYLQSSSRKLSNIGIKNIAVFPKNTVMMIGIGGTMGKASIINKSASCNQQINAIICNDLVGAEYLTYYLRAKRKYIFETAKYTTMPILNQEETKNIPVLLFGVREQIDIVKYIENKTQIIDQTIDRIKKEIDLITEYRTSLISAVVTGKIDVRGIEVDELPAEELRELEPADLADEQPEEDEILQSEVG